MDDDEGSCPAKVETKHDDRGTVDILLDGGKRLRDVPLGAIRRDMEDETEELVALLGGPSRKPQVIDTDETEELVALLGGRA